MKDLAPLIKDLSALATADLRNVDETKLCSPEALAARDEVVAEADNVECVTSPESQQIAVDALGKVNAMIKRIDTRRATDKAPFIAIGKLIETTAKILVAPLQDQSNRIQRLLSQYQVEVERSAAEERRKKQAELDRIEAERRKQEQEAAAAAASGNAAAVEEAQLKQAQLAVQAAAAVVVDEAPRPEGMRVRHVWRHEVTDARALYAARGEEFVKLEVKTGALSKVITAADGKVEIPGVRIWKEVAVNA